MVVDWALMAVFAALALPCVLRLVRLDYARLGHGLRHGDLAELLLVVAMVAMVSPVGGPIPAAGWQAVLVLTTGWFTAAWWRGRSCAHHALSAAAMFYMVTAMPHPGTHGPWLTMSTMDTRLALPLPAVAAAGYFVADAVRTGVIALRGTATTAGHASPAIGGAATVADSGHASRPIGGTAGQAPHAIGGAAGQAPHVMGGTAGQAPYAIGGTAGQAPHAIGGTAGQAPHAIGGTAGRALRAIGGATGQAPHATGHALHSIGGTATAAGSGHASRAICRVAMGAGMGYLLLASAL
ncbi:DUF5134 domain-containing protein [Amycolatopsis sp. FBCC-B4732]|uniref:DUF5134 domain-containing protein n=1 Tax=Amycolatopsis sp. FBCC-B4732 TaxID=3079339 RepID=UPI001FF4EA5C|nr:DUF5134 domain-containing protein [Amycolatopsis sp. FBCC-B4732]UOX84854.1 DUF5134 domain-containing protein [Amycolatopsis sp. FBCC-B4732]